MRIRDACSKGRWAYRPQSVAIKRNGNKMHYNGENDLPNKYTPDDKTNMAKRIGDEDVQNDDSFTLWLIIEASKTDMMMAIKDKIENQRRRNGRITAEIYSA